jgi:hypothetical protein
MTFDYSKSMYKNLWVIFNAIENRFATKHTEAIKQKAAEAA